MLSDVETLRVFEVLYMGNLSTSPISYFQILLGRRTLTCSIPGGGQASSGFPAQPPAWTSILPSQFCICPRMETLWRHYHHFGQPVPEPDCDFSFSWYWVRISCMVTWIHCLTSLVNSRLDHSFTDPIEFIWTVISNFIVNCSGDRTAGYRWPIMPCKTFHFGFTWIWYLLIGTVT